MSTDPTTEELAKEIDQAAWLARDHGHPTYLQQRYQAAAARLRELEAKVEALTAERDESRAKVAKVAEAMTPWMLARGITGVHATDAVQLLVKSEAELRRVAAPPPQKENPQLNPATPAKVLIPQPGDEWTTETACPCVWLYRERKCFVFSSTSWFKRYLALAITAVKQAANDAHMTAIREHVE